MQTVAHPGRRRHHRTCAPATRPHPDAAAQRRRRHGHRHLHRQPDRGRRSLPTPSQRARRWRQAPRHHRPHRPRRHPIDPRRRARSAGNPARDRRAPLQRQPGGLIHPRLPGPLAMGDVARPSARSTSAPPARSSVTRSQERERGRWPVADGGDLALPARTADVTSNSPPDGDAEIGSTWMHADVGVVVGGGTPVRRDCGKRLSRPGRRKRGDAARSTSTTSPGRPRR